MLLRTSHSLNMFPFSSTQAFVLDTCCAFLLFQFNALITLATFPARYVKIRSIAVPRRSLLYSVIQYRSLPASTAKLHLDRSEVYTG